MSSKILNQTYKKILFLPFFLFIIPQLIQGQITEKEIKAVYLEKFSLFIDWPNDSTEPFVIGVFQDKAFSKVLNKIYKNRKIKKRKVQLKYFTDINSIKDCNILFTSNMKDDEIKLLLTLTNKKPILTVSETEGATKKGIHIDLFKKGNRLKFNLNPKALKKSGLKASYQLMQSANIVNTKGEK